MQTIQSIPFQQSITIKGDRRYQTTDKVPSFIEMDLETLQDCINTYVGEKSALRANRPSNYLPKEKVIEILQADGTMRQLAELYGVDQSTISAIKSGRTHKKIYEQFKNK